jgi:eukaryotic-like serine/threonine-protein kinase
VLRAEGDLDGAAALWRRAAGVYGDLPDLRTGQWVVAACCHAELASVAGLPGSGVPAIERPLEAGRALELLRQAVAKGFRQLDWLRSESALDSLRSRSDFQLLLLDLAMPADPFAAAH